MTAIAANSVATVFPRASITALDFDQYCDLVEDCSILKELNLGSVSIRIVNHPLHGQIILANTAGETHAAVRL